MNPNATILDKDYYTMSRCNVQVYCAMFRGKDWPLLNQFCRFAQCLNMLRNVWVYCAMSELNVNTYEMNPNATILDKDTFWIRCWIRNLNGNGNRNKKGTTKHVQTLKSPPPYGRGLNTEENPLQKVTLSDKELLSLPFNLSWPLQIHHDLCDVSPCKS